MVTGIERFEEMTNLVAAGDPAGAADWLRGLMAYEDDLRRRNLMRPYEDRVTPLLVTLLGRCGWRCL